VTSFQSVTAYAFIDLREKKRSGKKGRKEGGRQEKDKKR